MITTNHLTKKFGSFTAVQDLNLEINSACIHGFIGPNGAGKTTTINMLIGAMIPTLGEGYVKNFKIGSKEANRLIGYAPEKFPFFSDLHTMNYLIYLAELSNLSRSKAIEQAKTILKLVGLYDYRYKNPSQFSSGMKKKLILAQALIHDPEVLFLDEPTANLDPETRIFIIDLLKHLVKEREITVFISSHILTELELIVDEITMINQGKMVLSGSIEPLRKKFTKGKLFINTDDNRLLMTEFKQVPIVDSIELDQVKGLVIETKEMPQLKKLISQFISKNELIIELMQEEHISLDTIYKNTIDKGGKINGLI